MGLLYPSMDYYIPSSAPIIQKHKEVQLFSEKNRDKTTETSESASVQNIRTTRLFRGSAGASTWLNTGPEWVRIDTLGLYLTNLSAGINDFVRARVKVSLDAGGTNVIFYIIELSVIGNGTNADSVLQDVTKAGLLIPPGAYVHFETTESGASTVESVLTLKMTALSL